MDETKGALGRHVFSDMGEGIAKLAIHGTMLPAEATAFVARLNAFQDVHEDAILIVDMTDAAGLEAGARKLIIDHERVRPYGVCFVRASFAIRALVGLMMNASKLLGQSFPGHFVEDEAAALAWCRTPPDRKIVRSKI